MYEYGVCGCFPQYEYFSWLWSSYSVWLGILHKLCQQKWLIRRILPHLIWANLAVQQWQNVGETPQYFIVSFYRLEHCILWLFVKAHGSSINLKCFRSVTDIFSVGGLTGVIIDVCLFFMVTSSIRIVRRSFFEVFWFTHHLFIIFYICLLCHASG